MTQETPNSLPEPKLRAKPKRIQNSRQAERWYRARLREVVRDIRREFNKTVRPLVLQSASADVALDRTPDEIVEALETLREKFENWEGLAGGLAFGFVARLNKVSKRKFSISMKGVMGINLETALSDAPLKDLLTMRTRENTRLIKSLTSGTLDRLEAAVLQDVSQGLNAQTIASNIKKAGEVSERKAEFIARDQTSKASSSLSQARMKQAGVTSYVWRSSRDERTREAHRRLDGKEFRLDKPPTVNGRPLHPGEDYNCRCTMEPVIKK